MSKNISVSASNTGRLPLASAAKTLGLWAVGLTLLSVGAWVMVEFTWVIGVVALVGVGYSLHASLRERQEAKAKSMRADEAVDALSDSSLAH